MEGRVEDADVRDALRRLLARLDALEVRGVVERREGDALRDELLRGGRELRRRRELVAAVDDAVADRVQFGEGGDDADLRVGQDGHDLADGRHMVLHRHLAHDLVAPGLRVDETRAVQADALHEPLAEHLLALHVEELELKRRRAAVDDENFLDLFHK